MVALEAPICRWVPEDDHLLKTAVEAGASLEALAKGAVPFSQRFTVQELRDRWHSLLYDPVISAEASELMIQFEDSASISKPNEEATTTSIKRKVDSVRKCYCAMRKRFCSEPFDPGDVSFLGGPGFSIDRKFDEHLSSDCILGDDEVSADVLGIEESKISITPHTFPELKVISAGSAISTGLYDNDECKSLYPATESLNDCASLGEYASLTEDENIVKEFDTELHRCLFETMDLDIQDSIFFVENSDNEGNVHSGPPSDSGTSLPNFHDYSTLPQMPNRSAFEGLATSCLEDTNATLHFHVNILGHSSVDSKPELTSQIPCMPMDDPNPNLDEYLVELSKIKFTPDDDLDFADNDEKAKIEKAHLELIRSILLDSPDEDYAPDLGISDDEVVPYVCLTNSPTAAHPGESGEQGQYHCDDLPVWSVEAKRLSSQLAVNPLFPELRYGVIFCTLNTEDLEIPDNDDVFLPICLPSASSFAINHTEYDESHFPTISSVEEFSYAQKATGRTLNWCQQSNYSQLHFLSDSTRSSYTTEPLPGDAQPVTVKKVTTCAYPALGLSDPSCNMNFVHGSEKQLLENVEQQEDFLNHNTFDSHLEKKTQSSNLHFIFQNDADGGKHDIDSTSNFQNREETADEAITIPVVSDQEELPNDSDDDDDDVPYSSDVEAMILDMDLSPNDKNLICNPGVLKYHSEDAKRIITRLEQAANASLQRMLFDHRAFAVLYGRCSRHFIKKTEVLIGRSTEDAKVDIDLGKECHSKISRRQATIKMDTNGSFHLTNHGKFSIFVNGKEVIPRENVGLVSGCLIQVHELAFTFDTYRERRGLKQSPGNSGNESQSLWEQEPEFKC